MKVGRAKCQSTAGIIAPQDISLDLSGRLVLVRRERESGSVMATTVPSKGGTGRFAKDKCLDFVRECGDQEIKTL
eukprot:1351740-Karenia_brevis.AAC.1